MRKYLLVEDDPEIAKIILSGLMSEGFEGEWASDGLEGLQKFRSRKYEFVIADVLLPLVNGLELVKRMRMLNADIPIVILSGLETTEERIKGLLAGADDYVSKPFALSEVQIRVKKLLRSQCVSTVLCVGDLKLDRLRRTLKRGDKQLDILEREFTLLDLLLSNPEKIISKEHILRDICGYNFIPGTNIVDVLICRLRDKIEAKEGAVSIRTIRGIGYKLHIDDKRLPEV
ncbi:response regulator transcription factor [Bdellovibrio sp. HCB274]|uniref:response regulator transcription factor n=1 Tax=Bdellovibrio sp. HCB274 TaxID=3394361 RepID=UPI0039B679DA